MIMVTLNLFVTVAKRATGQTPEQWSIDQKSKIIVESFSLWVYACVLSCEPKRGIATMHRL